MFNVPEQSAFLMEVNFSLGLPLRLKVEALTRAVSSSWPVLRIVVATVIQNDPSQIVVEHPSGAEAQVVRTNSLIHRGAKTS